MDSANSKQNNINTILLAILLVVVVAIATLLFLTFSGKSTDNKPAQTNADAAFTAQPQQTVTETVRETVRDSSTSTSASSKPTKLGNKGWIDDSSTQCGSGEQLWAAGREGTNYITICSDDGGSTFRYRANVNGGELDIKKVRAIAPENGRYTVDASPSTIEIYSTKLEVWTGDSLQKTLTFDSSWYEGE